MIRNRGSVFGGALLVTGTCIGAAMIGLPVKTAAGGFSGVLASFLIICGIMTLSALFMLEAASSSKQEANFINLAAYHLGKYGKTMAALCYVVFLYALLASYTSGGVSLINNILLNSSSSYSFLGFCIFLLPALISIYYGPKAVDILNRVLLLFLGLSYVLMLAYIFVSNYNFDYLPNNYQEIYKTLPLLVTSFGYHLLIPSLRNYFGGNVSKTRKAIIWGSLLSLVINLVWVGGIFVVLPNNVLLDLANASSNPGELLIHAIAPNSKLMALAVASFSFLALFSSFIGVALGVFDCLYDTLNITKKSIASKLFVLVLTFLPPLIFTLIYPSGFLLALHYAGVFAAILLILFPAVMAMSKRIKSHTTVYQVKGGYLPIILTILFSFIVIISSI